MYDGDIMSAAIIPSKPFMQRAIARAREGIEEGQTPFGACIVRDGEVVCCEHNVVWATTDITAHAEVHALRKACRLLDTIDLSDCIIYSTCEPCPMCFSAIHWAGIRTVVYGADIADAKATGFHELELSNALLKRLSNSPIEVVGGFMKAECAALFHDWADRPQAHAY